MKQWEYVGKRVRIIYKDGDVLEGFVRDYCDGEDSEDGIDSLVITNQEAKELGIVYGVLENEIKSIEIIG
ncbi:hypothetical protein [Geobacillus stearothermophilus]|uniref:hypothetical protein n=1 Tax=Geobacillus stearothermophilus TaxID=1422 RepID=UPI000507F897|nr:hypothetical protein [Geobacillus stearothermophilus]KFL14942.1 hypothetical protein ET31_14985 [Geobacillus stearothermophilus]KFX32961.1 hypothetical protein GT94_13580 [Geobacillus stearothermophilus]MDF9297530.1 hypothetical protein [Geobacillus stearothermophilus]